MAAKAQGPQDPQGPFVLLLPGKPPVDLVLSVAQALEASTFKIQQLVLPFLACNLHMHQPCLSLRSNTNNHNS
jgi:hypothetical protein